MADISTITLPSGDTYNIKDTVARSRIFQTKTFTGVIGTANDFANTTYYYGKIVPTSYADMWKIKFRVKATAAGRTDSKLLSEVVLMGSQSALSSYYAYNAVSSASYRPVYNHVLYRATAAGASNYGHALGISLFSAWNPINATNAREITIDILECYNCEFTFFNAMKKYTDIPGTGASNYDGYSEIDAHTNGLQETGDADSDTYNRLQDTYDRFTAGPNGIFQYSLIMQTADDTYESIVTGQSASNGDKVVNQNGFRLGTLRYVGNTTVQEGTVMPVAQSYVAYDACDARYVFNGITTDSATSALIANKAIYLVGTYVNGLFKLDETEWFTQTLPTSDDSKLYVYVGMAIDSYRYTFYPTHPIYAFRSGFLREVAGYALNGAPARNVVGEAIVGESVVGKDPDALVGEAIVDESVAGEDSEAIAGVAIVGDATVGGEAGAAVSYRITDPNKDGNVIVQRL